MRSTYIYIYICVCVCIYIYIYDISSLRVNVITLCDNFEVSHPRCVDQLSNQKNIKYMVETQLYIIITQISTYNYMFRPCILVIQLAIQYMRGYPRIYCIATY